MEKWRDSGKGLGKYMDLKFEIAAVAGVAVLLLFILLCRKKAQFLLGFVLRMVVGAVGIVICNQILESQQIAIAVGVNPVSLLTVGSLGVSGFGLLYGILFCKFL